MNERLDEPENTEMMDAEMRESDVRFLESLNEFIEEQKIYLQCPEDGASELRYIIYRSVFNKVIGRTSANRRLLLAIKSEYDGVIREMKKREEPAAASPASRLSTLRPAADISHRTSILQNQTAELQEEVRRRKSSIQNRLVPGLTSAQSADPEVLLLYLEILQTQREVLLNQKFRRVPVEVQTRLTSDLSRDRLRNQNGQLMTRSRRLKLVAERLQNWVESGRAVPLETLLGSVLQNIGAIGPDEDVAPPPGVPPPLLFFRALLVTVVTGCRLSAALSLRGVGCALRHGDTQLVAHAVATNKLSFTEELGDVLTEHAQKWRSVADLCLALAAVVYAACGKQRKVALSMCRRGLVHSAAEVMTRTLTAEDSLWLLSRSPSLSLLRLLTSSQRGQAAILSVGVASAFMLAEPAPQYKPALELLDCFLSRGMLEDLILEDAGASVDVWVQVASLCSHLKRDDLGRAVRSVLLDQNGTAARSPDPAGVRLMEHVFL